MFVESPIAFDKTDTPSYYVNGKRYLLPINVRPVGRLCWRVLAWQSEDQFVVNFPFRLPRRRVPIPG